MLPFHVFLASHESSLTMSKTVTPPEVRCGSPQPLRTCGGKKPPIGHPSVFRQQTHSRFTRFLAHFAMFLVSAVISPWNSWTSSSRDCSPSWSQSNYGSTWQEGPSSFSSVAADAHDAPSAPLPSAGGNTRTQCVRFTPCRLQSSQRLQGQPPPMQRMSRLRQQ